MARLEKATKQTLKDIFQRQGLKSDEIRSKIKDVVTRLNDTLNMIIEDEEDKIEGSEEGTGIDASQSAVMLKEGQLDTLEIEKDELEYLTRISKDTVGEYWKGSCRGKDVAIKKLSQTNLSQKQLDAFHSEVSVLVHLRHPNVVLFMGCCFEDGHYAIVTEYAERGTLSEVLQAHGDDLEIHQRMRMAMDIAQGLNWLHCSIPPVIHKNVQPNTLLVNKAWRVKIADLSASITGDHKQTEKDRSTLTATEFRYLSPEVIDRATIITAKADVYGWAVCVYHLFAKRAPFHDSRDFNTFKDSVAKYERPKIDDRVVPVHIAEIIKQSWAHDAAERPSFDDLIPSLQTAMIKCTIEDEAGQKFWMENFQAETSVVFRKFVKGLAKVVVTSSAFRDPSETEYKILLELLAKKDHMGDLTVKAQDLGDLLDRFGPLNDKFMQRIMATVKQKWYFGDISKEDAEQLLLEEKKGTFLVRLSSSTARQTPFTISKVDRNQNVTHQRIMANSDQTGYSLRTPKGKVAVKGNLPTFLSNKVRDALYLRKSCPGSKYQQYFVTKKPTPAKSADPGFLGAYMQDEEM